MLMSKIKENNMNSTWLKRITVAQALVGMATSVVCPPLGAAMMGGCLKGLSMIKKAEDEEAMQAGIKVALEYGLFDQMLGRTPKNK